MKAVRICVVLVGWVWFLLFLVYSLVCVMSIEQQVRLEQNKYTQPKIFRIVQSDIMKLHCWNVCGFLFNQQKKMSDLPLMVIDL